MFFFSCQRSRSKASFKKPYQKMKSRSAVSIFSFVTLEFLAYNGFIVIYNGNNRLENASLKAPLYWNHITQLFCCFFYIFWHKLAFNKTFFEKECSILTFIDSIFHSTCRSQSQDTKKEPLFAMRGGMTTSLRNLCLFLIGSYIFRTHCVKSDMNQNCIVHSIMSTLR